MVWQSVQANMPNNRIQIQGFPGHKATNFEYQSSNQKKKPEKRHVTCFLLFCYSFKCQHCDSHNKKCETLLVQQSILMLFYIRTPQWSLGLHDGVRWVDGVLHIFRQGSSRSQGSSQTSGLLGINSSQRKNDRNPHNGYINGPLLLGMMTIPKLYGNHGSFERPQH